MNDRSYPPLRFPACPLRTRHSGGRVQVWDRLRKAWLVLTPEEWVRRHLIAWLVDDRGVEPVRIVQEYPVPLGGMAQRADVVVVGTDCRPLLLAECKAPDVRVTREVFAQAVRYNSVVGARFLMLTNGIDHYLYEAGADGYQVLGQWPDLTGL